MEFIKIFIANTNLNNLFLYTFLSIGPTIFWLFLCLWFDRASPEPAHEIFKFFLYGSLITIPLILITGPLTSLVTENQFLSLTPKIFVTSFLIDGLIEEFVVCITLIFLIRHLSCFDEPRDGMVYGMTLALGLAFVENILYGFMAAYQGGVSLGASTVLIRGFTTTLMHFLAGGIIGYYLGMAIYPFKSIKNDTKLFEIAKKYKKIKWLTIFHGLVLAIIFHGLFNTIIRFNQGLGIYPLIVILVIVYFYILKNLRSFQKT